MSVEKDNKAVLRRWYEEMYNQDRIRELMPILAGPTYTRHEASGTRTITIEEYIKEQIEITKENKIRTEKYELIAEEDKVVVIWRGRFGDTKGVGVQAFRFEKGKIVETWFPCWAKDVEWDW